MEKNALKPVEKNDEVESREVKYLMHQYPWFSRDIIVDAMKKEDRQIGKILTYLDSKSGSWPEMFGF